MEIKIKYDSIWGNSFLSPENDKKRKYIASLSTMNANKNKNNKLDFYKKRDIELTTVYGLIYRLIGARKPLNKILKEDKSFISELIKEGLISFDNKKISETDELVYLRNNSLNTDRNSYSGVPNDSLFSMGLKKYIEVLFYSKEELFEYLVYDKEFKKDISDNISILELSKILEDTYKNKKLKIISSESDKQYLMINEAYKRTIDLKEDIDKNANLALLAINKSIKSFYEKNENTSCFLTKSGTFSGVSLNGNSFTLKDFMKKFASPKITYGNPYKTDFWVLNPYSKEGKNMKFNKQLSKSGGLLTIKIDCDKKMALEIKTMIENAGVSSFYLGKKGLAYIQKITL